MRQNYSRLKTVEERKNIKNSLIFGGLTLLILILGLFFGVPFFSKFAGLFSKKTVTTAANSPVPPPQINNLPEFTNQQSIVVKGTAKENAIVSVFVNDEQHDADSDDSGNFTTSANLKKGANSIFAKAREGNTESTDSNHYTVNFDNEPPKVDVISPTNGQSFFGDKQRTINVAGQVDNDTSVTVNDRVAIVDGSGKFNLGLELGDGDNNIKIVATDKARNKKEINLQVSFNP